MNPADDHKVDEPAADAVPIVHVLNRHDDQFLEALTRTNNDLANLQRELARQNAALVKEIAAREKAEAELEVAHLENLEISHRAGMAEIATSVLHNVGNVLNSVNVSASLLGEAIRQAPVNDLRRVVALLQQQGANLGAFFTNDPRGPQLTTFLDQLASSFTRQQEVQLQEVAALEENITHIKEIVAMQQTYARVSGVVETLSVSALIEDTLRLSTASFHRHEVEVVRDFAPDLPPVTTEKHKALQILVNLLNNAKAACDASGHAEMRVTVRTSEVAGRVRLEVIDNGVGIPAENLARIFNHGFTTKKDGHGFGLHSAANAATELGGRLFAESDGPGCGATFTLELPLEPPAKLS